MANLAVLYDFCKWLFFTVHRVLELDMVEGTKAPN